MKMQVIRTLAVVMMLGVVGFAQTFTELLQKGIYVHDTVGDLDAAIRLYQQIIAGAPPSSDVRVQAERRLRAAEAQRRFVAAHPMLATYDGRTYRHKRTGLSFDVPEGWKVNSTGGSSDNGEMVTISATDPEARVAVWMIPEKNDAEGLNKKLDDSPFLKAKARAYEAGYRLREGSIQRVYIAGRAAMVAIADYSDTAQNPARAMAEYMTWIYTPETHVFFFTRVSADELERHKPQFDALVYSAVIP